MKKRDQKWLVGLICVFIVGVALGALGHFALTRLQLKTPAGSQEETAQEENVTDQETADEEIKDSRDEEYLEAYQQALKLLERGEITLGISRLRGIPKDYRNVQKILDTYDTFSRWQKFFHLSLNPHGEGYEAGLDFRLVMDGEEMKLQIKRREYSMATGMLHEEETYEATMDDLQGNTISLGDYQWRYEPGSTNVQLMHEDYCGAEKIFYKYYMTYSEWISQIEEYYEPRPVIQSAMDKFRNSYIELYSVGKPWTAPDGTQVEEWLLWNDHFVQGFNSANAARSKTFTWLDEERTENYLYTKTCVGESYEIDYYGDGFMEEWGLRNDTGEVVVYHRFDHEQSGEELTMDELAEVCKDYASFFIDTDSEKYNNGEDFMHEFTEGYMRSWQVLMNLPDGRFAYTNEYVLVEVGMDGTLWNLEAHMLGEIEKMIEVYGEDKLEADLSMLFSESTHEALQELMYEAYPGHEVNLYCVGRWYMYPWVTEYVTNLGNNKPGRVIGVYIDGPEDQYDKPDLIFLLTRR
ncbi:MAG: hypothetical protein J5589_06680 [Firmicutes bacterium]|nr:hypothetical protein [Bacillota bacterium]